MLFRPPDKSSYLRDTTLATAHRVATGDLDWEKLRQLPLLIARDELTTLPGVGKKTALCSTIPVSPYPHPCRLILSDPHFES
jgi:3-methyladenine DNA glycosylase/8-oxoguanine DNA glycosylase